MITRLLTLCSVLLLLVPSLPAAQWSGSVQANYDAEDASVGYSRHETQTWTLNADAPTLFGSIAIYSAKWRYRGTGTGYVSAFGQTANFAWSIDTTSNVQLVASAYPWENKVSFQQYSPPTTIPNGIALLVQTIDATGMLLPFQSSTTAANEWSFPSLLGDSTLGDTSGSFNSLSNTAVFPLPILGTSNIQPTITGSWHFTYGDVVLPFTPTISGTTKTVSTLPINASNSITIIPRMPVVAKPTLATHKGHYRITATNAHMNLEEQDNNAKLHGRVNEIYFTSFSDVFDRRNGNAISTGPLMRTSIYGDTNNSDPVKGFRIRAGSYSSSGGIQTGDDVTIITPNFPNLGALSFIPWEGDLSDGIDVVVLRPAVWVVGGNVQPLFTPYSNRLQFNEHNIEIATLPEVANAIANFTTVSSDLASHNTSGTYSVYEDRPIGMKLTTPSGNVTITSFTEGRAASSPDHIVVLTREKIEAFLAGQSGRNLEVNFKGSWTGAALQPLGDCTLNLWIERL